MMFGNSKETSYSSPPTMVDWSHTKPTKLESNSFQKLNYTTSKNKGTLDLNARGKNCSVLTVCPVRIAAFNLENQNSEGKQSNNRNGITKSKILRSELPKKCRPCSYNFTLS
jgi:hypothetical protein